MTRSCFLCLVFSLTALSACASEEAPALVGDAALVPAAADPLSGTWTGDWGPAPDHRNPVTLALTWDGTNLTGTVNPGPNAVAITKASYAPDTGMVMMEASANGTGGKTVHYTVEGKMVEGAITGTWANDGKKGDFKVTKG